VRLWIKICGVRSEAAVTAALAAGVEAIGFVFHESSPRNLRPAEARRLATLIPVGVLKVAVTRHPTQQLIDEVTDEFSPNLWQTDARDIPALRLPVGTGWLPVYRTGEAVPAVLAPRCLYEGADSGRGLSADWVEARRLASRTEIVLAGGLRADNVGSAIREIRPFGVDVSSGVESTPGVKDVRLIGEFVAAARAASMANDESRNSGAD
jgi:phosphoribosylanthranilate isomerase